MKHNKIKSTIIESVGYDTTSKTLEVKFRNGAVYEYYNVNMGKHIGIMTAPSAGTYLTKNIEPNHKYKRQPVRKS